MSLNCGLGDVTIKNQLFNSNEMYRGITVIKHCNSTDYWIITHSNTGNNFYSFSLTQSGINSTPIISNIGFAA